MATYFLSQSPTIANFVLTGNQNPDVFIVDTGVASSRLRILQSGSNVIITDGTRTATLQNFAVGQITTGQFSNNDGSVIFVGANDVGVTADANDNGAAFTRTTGGDLFIGLGGADTGVDGGAGNDYLVGNIGNDTFTAAASATAGNDTVYGGQGDDTIDYSAATSGNLLLSGNLGNDVITGGAGNDTIFGGQGNDTIVTNGGNNIVDGNLGLDNITGGAGNDTLRGGDGEDVLNGGAGRNVVSGQVGDDIITGTATSNDTAFGGQGQDIINYSALAAGEVSQLFGNLGNDSILGGAGNDTINGGQGNDTITGNFGADSLTGGLGLDRFTFLFTGTAATSDSGATTATADVITDFVTGIDRVIASVNGAVTAGTGANYIEFADATVTSVETALTRRDATAGAGIYTFIAGATDGYLVIDGNNGGAGDAVITLRGLNTLAGFDSGDLQAS